MAEPARPDWVPAEHFPFTDRWATVEGCRVHFVDEGEGPVLLMLHGNPTWSFLYRHLIRGLRDRFRCIAVDLPGFGLSGARAGYGFTAAEHARVVEGLVLELDLTDLTPVMQDWGGPIGFAVAGRHPDRIRALVIANTWAWPMTKLSGRAFSAVLGGPVGRRLIERFNVFVELILLRGLKRAKLSDAEREAYRGPFPDAGSRRPTAVFPQQITDAAPFLGEVERGLAQLRDRPALILWPTGDPAFGTHERERFERTFPDHRTVMIEGAGHYVQEDAPDELIGAIRGWEALSGT